ncbi:MAG TPA: cytidine deaminase [Candidatus Saccharimonadales bacterium]
MPSRNEKLPAVVFEKDYSAEASAGNFDPLVTFFHNGEWMIINARAIRENYGRSHRNVFVGSALLANKPEIKKQRIYVGWNDSPYKGASKFCAEMRAIEIADKNGYTRREAIIVPGETDPEVIRSIIGVPSRILPPCEPCREILSDDTVVMSIGGKEDIYGAFTGRMLRRGGYLLGKLADVRRPSEDHFVQPPIFDLGKLNWAVAEEAYRDFTAELKGDSNLENELRFARAAIAVQVLNDPAYLLDAA